MLIAVSKTKILFLVIINLRSCDTMHGSTNDEPPKAAPIFGSNYIRNIHLDDFIAKLQQTTVYDTSMRPNYEGGTLNVSTSLSVISMDNMDLMSMDYQIDFYLYHEWNDKRLEHSVEEGIVLDEELYDKIWMPDTYIVNSKESSFHKVILDNKQIKISKDGHVKLSLRLTTRASCPIDLRSFPWDIQHCPLVMESYAYSDKEVRYSWNMVPMEKKNFVFASKIRELSQYSLVKVQLRSKQSQYAIGNWSTVEAVFHLRRKNGLYLLQTMGPSLITVIISWITFIIRFDQHPARISLGITSILTMEAIQLFIESSLPQVNYMTMLDVYSVMAYFFVYLAMIEYAFVLIVVEKGKSGKKEQATPQKVRLKKSKKEVKSIIAEENAKNVDESADQNEPETRMGESSNQRLKSKFGKTRNCLKTAYEIDSFARVFFPISFILFNLFFWIYINIVTE